MTREEALAMLETVRKAMHEQFEDGTEKHGHTHAPRLHAIDGALDNAAMHIQHLHDEEAREVDLAQRILRRETVHEKDEVRDHSGRSLDHTRTIAARGQA